MVAWQNLGLIRSTRLKLNGVYLLGIDLMAIHKITERGVDGSLCRKIACIGTCQDQLILGMS